MDHLLVHLGVALGHERQQGRLGLGGDAVVLVDDLDSCRDPRAPLHANVRDLLGADQIAGQRTAEQVGQRQLRMAVLDPLPNLVERGACQQGHEGRHRRLAASGSADEDQPTAGDEVEQRQQDEGGVGGGTRQFDPCSVLADHKRRPHQNIVIGGDEGVVGDPVVGAAEFPYMPRCGQFGEAQGGVGAKRGPAVQPGLNKLLSVHKVPLAGGSRVRSCSADDLTR